MSTIKYYSAEYVGPSLNKGSRLLIRRRDYRGIATGVPLKNYFAWDSEAENNEWDQVKLRFHSPFLKVEKLWYDEALSVLFFRTIED